METKITVESIKASAFDQISSYADELAVRVHSAEINHVYASQLMTEYVAKVNYEIGETISGLFNGS